MKRCLLVTYLISFVLTVSWAQKSSSHSPSHSAAPTVEQNTSSSISVNSPRYMIVQSPLAARLTFKLDTYLGNVYQLRVSSTGEDIWERVIRMPGITEDTQLSNTSNYCLFLSTIANRYTF